MSKIEISVSSQEAEEVLVALSNSAKQTKLSEARRQEVEALGQRLSRVFEKQFGWQTTPGVFEAHNAREIRVNVVSRNRW